MKKKKKKKNLVPPHLARQRSLFLGEPHGDLVVCCAFYFIFQNHLRLPDGDR